MNAWLLAACVLLPTGMAACLWTACRGEPVQRLLGITLGGVVACTVFLLVARGLERANSYTDLALIAAVLTPAGTLVFARFVGGEHQLPPQGGNGNGNGTGDRGSGTGGGGHGNGRG